MPWCVPLARWGPVKHIDMTFIIRFLKEQQEVPGVDNDTRVGGLRVQSVSTLVVFFFLHLEHGWFRFSSQYFCDHSVWLHHLSEVSPAELQKRVCSVLGAEKAGFNGLQVPKFHGFEVNLRRVLRCEMRICLVLLQLLVIVLNCFLEWWTSQFSQGQKWLITELFRCSFIPVPPWLRWNIHETCSERPLNS